MERSYFKMKKENMLGVYARYEDSTNMATIVIFPIVKIGFRYYAIESCIFGTTEKCENYEDYKDIALKYLDNFDENLNTKDVLSEYAFRLESVSDRYLNCKYTLVYKNNICDVVVKTDIINNKPFANKACIYEYDNEDMYTVCIKDITKLMFNDKDKDTED